MSDDELPKILFEIKEMKATIIFNRPKERSPLSIEVLETLHQIIDQIVKNAKLKTVIFTGREDVFASGANLREIALVTGATAREYAMRGQNLMRKITEMPQETIAFVNGFCFGG